MKSRAILCCLAVCGGVLASEASGTIVFQDNFDTHPDGAVLNTRTPTVGANWTFFGGGTGTAANHVVQDDFAHDGNAYANTRPANLGGGNNSTMIANATASATIKPNHVVTYKFDMLVRTTANGGVGFTATIGNSGAPFFNNQGVGGKYRFTQEGGVLNTSAVSVIVDRWDTIEIVETFADVAMGSGLPFASTIDVFLTTDTLPRTQIFTDLPGDTLIEGGATHAPYIRFINDAPGTSYIDNVSIDISPVPEPGSLIVALAGGALMVRRPRRAC